MRFRISSSMVVKVLLVLAACHFSFTTSYADNRQARKLVRQGNAQYRNNNRHEAQVTYFKAVAADSTDARAQYNLATSMFPQDWKMVQQEQRDTMAQTFLKAAELEQNPYRKSQAYHNMGVVYQGAKDFQKAIEAYKQALRNNPNDDEARYNLVLCQRQLKNDGQGGGGSGQNDQQEDKQKQDEQKQQQQQQEKQDEQQQQQEQQEPPMSKENAEQLLNAAMQQEKKTQERMQQQQQQGQRRRIEKNW